MESKSLSDSDEDKDKNQGSMDQTDASEESFTSEDYRGTGYQSDNMAYKSVEIDEGLFRNELTEIRNMYWRVQENISDSYDFGLI